MSGTVVLLLMTSAVVAPAPAPDAPASVRLTLAEAVDRARARAPRVDEARALHDAAAADVRGARAQRLPQVDLHAAYTRYSHVPELAVEFPGRAPLTVFPDIPNQYRSRAEMSVPLYTGGRVEGVIAAARQRLAAAEADVAAAGSDLVLETTTAYWSLVAARESARVLAASIASYEADLKQVRDRADVGMAARNDVLGVQVERDRAELARLEAENAAAIASEDLARLLGLPPGSRVDPAEPLEDGAPAVTDDGLAAQAIERRPEIAALRARVAAAEGNVAVARSARLPQAAVVAGYDYANPNPRILPLDDTWNDTWSVGVSVSYRPFDGGRTSAAVARARAEADAARHRLADLERRVRLEVTARVLDLGTRRTALAVAERTVQAARENVQVAQDRYREGLVPASELLDAQLRALQAGLDRTRAATRLRQARADLDRALGR